MDRTQIVPGLSVPFFPMRPRTGLSLTSAERIESVVQRIKAGDTVQKKLNGDRAILVAQAGHVTLFNRHCTNYSHTVMNSGDFATKFGLAVLDGEVWRSKFYPFDVLVWEGHPLLEKAASVREEAAIMITERVGLRWIYAFDRERSLGIARNWLYGELRQEHTLKSQWEGVVVKAKDSPYRVLGTDSQDSLTWSKWKYPISTL